ncbi:periplasmic binding protein-like I [Zychaea mexicana]|uniref:periplasmic binding protein-like I n=1 Tax=Zychaea mexicana TaxID=64656 RepID=UPI0022FF026B|nr:periplasmic binding protein-like I [Zychaea mexicana]KAI9491860.1 periplasmic binding protein-like I [Zychaea mexicana]
MEWGRRPKELFISLQQFLFIFLVGALLFVGDHDDHLAYAQTSNSSIPTYTIGVIFPDPSQVRQDDPTLNDMIVASNAAIDMVATNIVRSDMLSDVNVEFVRYISDADNVGQTAWTTVDTVNAGVNAVIGDMISTMTETEAGITGVQRIPQCSCASASLALSDKEAYPYFFRTVGNVVLFGSSLVDWVQHMGWKTFALIYTNDNVGQQVLKAMVQKAETHGIEAMTQVPLYDMTRVGESLEKLATSGARIVIFADSTTTDQLTVLRTAQSMGLLSEGWVWMLTNDMSPAIRDMVSSPEELATYDGLMFISGLWNLTGIPAYDAMQQAWQELPIPDNFTTPDSWKTAGLAYNAPNAYACAELLALGLNKALDTYTGGRQKGLSDLSAGTFNSSIMTPTFYNLDYTGPAGHMDFTDTGDLATGYFGLQYMVDGQVVTYATLKDGYFEFMDNTTIIYLGHTTTHPVDIVAKYALNPTSDNAGGIIIMAISALGLLCCIVMMILIILFRDLKSITVSSPTFCCLQLIGLMMGYIGATLYIDKPNAATCISRKFLITGAFVLVIGSIIAKNYRIYRIFQNVFTVRTSRLKSFYLMRIVAIFGAIAFIPFIVWHAVYPVQVVDLTIGTSMSYCWLCVYPGAKGDWIHLNAAELVALIWCAILILCAALLAWKTRNVRGKWAEANQIAYVSYNTILAACLATPSFFMPDENFLTAIYLKLSALLLGATFTLVVIFTPKLVIIIQFLVAKYRDKFRFFSRRYRKNGNGSGEESLSAPAHFEDTSDSSHGGSDNLAARNLLDFSVQAHEGVLPVKKVGRFNYMTIWELKRVVVVPLKRFFVLMNKTSTKAEVHHYLACEALSTAVDRYLFRVLTEDNVIFMFQVYDQVALDRWISWFAGPVDSGNSATNKNENNNGTESQAPINTTTYETTRSPSTYYQQEPLQNSELPTHNQVVDPLATFGAVRATISMNASSITSACSATPRATTHTDNTSSAISPRRRSSHHYYPEDDNLSAMYYHNGPSVQDDIVNDSSDMLLRDHHQGDLGDMWTPSSQYFPLSPSSRLSFDIAMDMQQINNIQQQQQQQQQRRNH